MVGDNSDLSFYAHKALAAIAVADSDIASIIDVDGITSMFQQALRGNGELRTATMQTLVRLSKQGDFKIKLVQANGIPWITNLLQCGNLEQKIMVAQMVCEFAQSEDSKDLVPPADALPPLIELVHDGDTKGKALGFKALLALASVPANAKFLIDRDALPTIITEVNLGNNEQKMATADALWHFTSTNEGRREITWAGALFLLIALVRDGDDQQSHCALKMLRELCDYPGTVIAIHAAGGLTPLKYLADNKQTTPEGLIAVDLISILASNPVDLAGFARTSIDMIASGTSITQVDGLEAIGFISSNANLMESVVLLGVLN